MIKPNLLIENSTLKVRNIELIDDSRKTYLTSAAAASASTLTVQNIAGAAVSGYLILGEIGTEECELIQIHAATAPSGSTITLASNTSFAHPTDTACYLIDYNQIEFSRATTSGGSKSVLSTVTITPDSEFTRYADTNTTGYAYARFKNSSTTTYSQYSDEQSYSNLAYNSCGRLITRILRKSNEEGQSFVTRQEILEEVIWDFIDLVNDLKTKYKHEEADQDASQTLTIGGENYTLPSDIKYSDKRSIIDIRVQGDEPLQYISLTEWAVKIAGLTRSTLNGAVLDSAITITLTDASDFPDSGNGYIDGDAFSWTGKTSNTLTGVTGITAHSDDDVVWHEDSLSLPSHYTFQNGTLKLYPPADDDNDGKVLIIDYYKRITHPDSENDIFPIPYNSPLIDHGLAYINSKKGKDGVVEAERYERVRDKKLVQIIKNERLGRNITMTTKE